MFNNGTFIVAELSANHSHNIDVAKKTIIAAKDSGADAIKLQTYTPDTITIDCDNEYFQIKHGTIWDGQTLYALYKEAYTPWEWHRELKRLAESLGLVFFSTPFDKTAVDFLEELNVTIYKIASLEIVDIPLIKYVASKGKPILVSTGVANLEDIELAVKTCRKEGNNDVVLLKCTSSYPAPLEEANLLTIPDMRQRFKVCVGLSDHTMGIDTSVAAVALGAKVIEKHFILDRTLGGPDASFSMEPNEFKKMVNSVRNVEKAVGKVSYDLSEKTRKSREFSKSLFVVEDVKKGEKLSEKNIRSIRPGCGLHPKHYYEVLSCQATKDLVKGTPLNRDMFKRL